MVKEYDEDGYTDCFKDKDNLYNMEVTDNPYEGAHILNSDLGGDTMKSVFKDLFSNLNKFNLEDSFINFMKMMHPLFEGLKEMNKGKIVHNDIKPINIIEKDGVLKYIDFGLTGKINNPRHFINRSVKEYNTKRIYYYYPLEYIFFSSNDISDKINIKNRKHYKLLAEVYNQLDLDIDKVAEYILDIINTGRINIKNIIPKIDVYGLGILVPILFHTETNIQYPYMNSKIIKDFYDLFRNMIHPDLSKRYSSLQSYNKYMELMKPHMGKKIGSSRKTPKRKQTPRRQTARRQTARRQTARRQTPRRQTARRQTARRQTPRKRLMDRRRRRGPMRRMTPRRRSAPRIRKQTRSKRLMDRRRRKTTRRK